MQSPCKDCDKKGCGAYHDQCQPYQDFIKLCNEVKHNRRLDNLSRKLEYVRDDTYRSRGNKLFLSKKGR